MMGSMVGAVDKHPPPTSVTWVQFPYLPFCVVEFVLKLLPCSEGYPQGSLVFLPPLKPALLNFNLINTSVP